jgi:glycerophosphoryl diester phosphodiesterase
MVLPETVERCHECGVAVNAWTVDDPEIMKQMLKCGVDWITSNKADVAIACRDDFLKGAN